MRGVAAGMRGGAVGAGARWARAGGVVLATGLVVSLAACSPTEPGDRTPRPVETITASAAPEPSASPTVSATPTTPSPTPSTAEPVDATGSMAIFAPVSEALAGTCSTTDAGPTISLSDPDNEFYRSVDVTVVLDADRAGVASVAVEFEEDSEGFHWELSYDASDPAKGTSGKLAVSGRTYTVSGKLTAEETRKGKTRTEVLPYRIVARCASRQW